MKSRGAATSCVLFFICMARVCLFGADEADLRSSPKDRPNLREASNPTGPSGIIEGRSSNLSLSNLHDQGIENFCSSGNFLLKWGIRGDAEGEFLCPAGVGLDPSGNVYVADPGNHRIQKFDSSGNFLGEWGTYGFGEGEFCYPYGVAVDALGGQLSGHVYVADTLNHRVQKFDSEGKFLTMWGSKGTADGEFWHPHGVAVGPSGEVFVTDWSPRIQKFDSEGKLLETWGSRGSGHGELWYSHGIAVDPSGNVFVADADNHRIQEFDSEGRFLASWGSIGSGDGEFFFPNGVAVDSSGGVYVADSGNHRVQKFDSSGRFLTKWGALGSGDGEFRRPFGIAAAEAFPGPQSVFIMDTYNHRVQKFRSGFGMRGITGPLNAPVIEWHSVPDGLYDVWASDDLVDWIALASNLSASGTGVNSWTDTGLPPYLDPPSEVIQRFYRVELLNP